MSWLRRVLGPREQPTVTRVAPIRPSPDLIEAQRRHRELLTRADLAIKEAMEHADEMFSSGYTGPERRRSLR
jgi:hypothetical protein